MIFVDRSLIALLWPLVDQFETVRHIVVMDDGKGEVPEPRRRPSPARLRGPAGRRPARSQFRVDDENRAAAHGYTSGTTGNPKGVVYSHRSTFLHTLGAMIGRAASACRRATSSCRSCRCSTPTRGASPTPRSPPAPASSCPDPTCRRRRSPRSSSEERVTIAAGVPTIWMGVLPELKGRGHVVAARHPLWRLGGAEGAVRGLPRADGPADHAGLGHDRDQPDRRRSGRIKSTIDATARRRRAGRPAHHRRASRRSASSARIVRPGQHRVAAVGRRELGRAAGARAPGSRPPTTTTSARRRASPRTGG